VKLPPLSLVAPSLCPRCDQPAMVLDPAEDSRCGHCGFQLHQCGSCRGVAGPFDRYCGFCGHELVRGMRPPAWWRLRLPVLFLILLVPVTAGLIYGLVHARL